LELQRIEVSLDAQARKLQEDLATIRSDHLRDYDLTHIKVQATINETLAEIDATRRELPTRLEGVVTKAERVRGQGVCARTAQPLIFDGTTSWAVKGCQFETVVEHHH
jgi:hypothetical protein